MTEEDDRMNQAALLSDRKMTKQSFLDYCLDTFGTSADFPFDGDFETAVLRHTSSRKWYALVMRISRRKVGIDSDEMVDVVNLKLPTEMIGSFDAADGVYPAYHMNKVHWISVVLDDADAALAELLVHASYEATRGKNVRKHKTACAKS